MPPRGGRNAGAHAPRRCRRGRALTGATISPRARWEAHSGKRISTRASRPAQIDRSAPVTTADSRVRTIPAAIAEAFTNRPRLSAMLIYVGFAAILFGRAAAPHFTTVYLGRGIDQAFFIWCLVWWPYAIA